MPFREFRDAGGELHREWVPGPLVSPQGGGGTNTDPPPGGGNGDLDPVFGDWQIHHQNPSDFQDGEGYSTNDDGTYNYYSDGQYTQTSDGSIRPEFQNPSGGGGGLTQVTRPNTDNSAIVGGLLGNANQNNQIFAGGIPYNPNINGAVTPYIGAANQLGGVSLADLAGFGTGIGIGNTEATTREVTDNELVANQLEGLLSGNSPYIRNARLRAMELANKRGALGSSFAAGAAERAAIESALPIATADAQAFRDAATQNMSVLNQFALANLQRATTLDTALLDSNTRINMANLDAATRVSVANLDAATRINISNLDAETQAEIAKMNSATQLRVQEIQAQLQLTMQGRNLTHDVGMEQLKQSGRVDLAMLDADLRIRLAEMGVEGNIDLANLNNAQQLELNTILAEYELEKQMRDTEATRRMNHSNLAMEAQRNYASYLASFAGVDMDANAAARLREEAKGFLRAQLEMINGLYPEFEPILPQF